jgi:LmbE family N-acetylglucosaminyl deacetylase
MHVVFVMAHQDDEIAFASRIRTANARGHRVTCVCLTDGAAGVASEIRDAESRSVLERLGGGALIVADDRIHDALLAEDMERALAFLESAIADVNEIVTLAYEGGHQDHDAAFLIASVFAEKRGVPCIEMPLYNGHRTPGSLFRVFHPMDDGWTVRRIPFREKLANLLLVRFYRSQRRSWLGLAPMMLLAPARELTRVADPARAAAPPHPGALLYERRFGYPYSRFAARAASFLRLRARRD